MDRIAAGSLIALATLAMTLGGGRDVLARDLPVHPPAPAIAAPAAPATPASGRILGLLMTLEALRAAPALLDSRKV